MKIIFSQLNPGREYRHTRHNVGGQIIDKFAHMHSAVFKSKSKFHAELAELTIGSEKVLLVKPSTYYNETGRSARQIANFYGADTQDILIIHDELALPLGTLRTRVGGSDAGNNGIKSLNQHLSLNTCRLRVGISGENRQHMTDVNYVLGRFDAREQTMLDDEIIPTALRVIEDFIAGDFEITSYAV